MEILILGGTVFLGRALVEAAQARGHRLTLFNRGKSNPELFPDVETIHGDRSSDLSALGQRRWDAVIDTCGYVPRVVRLSAEALAERVGHYTFISSLSVYADASRPGLDESAPVGVLADESVEKVDGETYGPLKALCEQAAQRAVPGRTLVVRPGLIVGAFDPSDRFTYWPWRVDQGGEVLAPGAPQTAVQIIDVRDLAEWTVSMVEGQHTGVYNAVGPQDELSMGELLESCRKVSGSDARLNWVDEAFLLAQGVQPWSDLPVWIPVSDASSTGFHHFDCRRAIAEGLRFRPIEETVRATLEWVKASRPANKAWRAGITREKEAELLALWKQQG
jgi:2'-hydroxyisoflavone reductase